MKRCIFLSILLLTTGLVFSASLNTAAYPLVYSGLSSEGELYIQNGSSFELGISTDRKERAVWETSLIFRSIDASEAYGNTTYRGFTSIALQTGLDYLFTEHFGLRAAGAAEYSTYAYTKVRFAHLTATLAPYVALELYDRLRASILFPLTFDFRRDLTLAASAGIGLAVSYELPKKEAQP